MNLSALSSGVEAEQVPVAALDGLLHLSLAVGHAALDAVHLAGSVADDEGGTVIGLSLLNGLEGLSGVSAHGYLSHIHIAVAHGDLSQRLLLGLLTGSGELCHLADVGGLGSLTAGVGVDLGIEDEDVDVLAGSQNVVHAAEADVVGPAVAAEDPDGLLRQIFLVLQDLAASLQASQSQSPRAETMFSMAAMNSAEALLLAAPSAMVSSHFWPAALMDSSA